MTVLFKHRVNILLSLALICFIAVGLAAYRCYAQLSTMEYWLGHTYQVVGKLNKLSASIRYQRNYQMSYILLGDKELLAPYYAANASLLSKVDEIANLTQDNPVQRANVANLRKYMQKRIATADELMKIMKDSGKQKATDFIRLHKEQIFADPIYPQINRMETEEARLLKFRTASAQRSATELLGVLLASGLVVAAVMAIGVWARKAHAAAEALQEIYYETITILSETVDMEQAVSEVIIAMCRRFGWMAGAYWVPDTNGETLRCVSLASLPGQDISQFRRDTEGVCMRAGEGVAGKVWASGSPVWISNIAFDNRFLNREAAQKAGLGCVVAFPLKARKKVVGVLHLFRKGVRKPDQGQIALFESLGRQIGTRMRHKELEQSLRMSEERLRTFTESVTDYAITMLDPSGTVISWGEGAHNMLGYYAEEIIGQNFSRFYTREQNETGLPQHILKQARETGQYHEEIPRVRKDGSEFFADVLMTALKDEQGKLLGYTGLIRDITERKEMENRMSEFYSVVSHELRTPLTSIRASLGLMEGGKAGQLTERATQLVRLARTESERLVRLINDILDLRKIEAGQLELHLQPLSVDELLYDAVERIKSLGDNVKVNIKVEGAPDTVVMGDRDKCLQILMNLLSNAIKFSPPDSEIMVKANRSTPDHIRVSVTDKGQGIPSNKLHKLFQKFQQIDSSDVRAKGGTGLGLSISKALVEQHGGSIGVESNPGAGSAFWFELPASSELPVLVSECPSKYAHEILLVEDDPTLCTILQQVLEPEGFLIKMAATIAEAKQHLKTSIPEVMILDLKLPDGYGLDLMAKLKEDPQTENLPVVVMTGQQPDEGACTEPNLIDWLVKPFDVNRLKHALRVAVRSMPKAPVSVLVVEDDPSTREIVVDQLNELGVECAQASDGAEAIHLFRQKHPDLVILDIGIPALNGFEVVEVLRKEKRKATPLIIYTVRDLTAADRERLTLGLTRHLIKSETTTDDLVGAVRELLNGLVSKTQEPGVKLGASTGS